MPSNLAPQVFVVDDEPVIASTLAAILRRQGFQTKFFTSPLEALAAARSQSPDLLISDIEMTGLSGMDLAIQMKAQYPTCKVLLFSARPTTAHSHSYDLMLKPVFPRRFLAEIEK